ncbi:MAG: molybdopterin cofactor-binding domain-containing protein [Vicinamibacterales bacterium]
MSARGTLPRRDFLRLGAAGAGGLLVAFTFPSRAVAGPSRAGLDAAAEAVELNAFIHVGTDDVVTLFIHKAEMGQGTVTSLAMLLAEELECDWSAIRTEFPGVDPKYGRSQGVYGSSSIRGSWNPLREAGAEARERLIAAAAARWNVAPSACRAERGAVINTVSGARLRYGALADAAAALPGPSNPRLKDPSQFELIGTPVPRLDTPAKVDGTAAFGIDTRVPDLRYAVIARCPVFGGRLARVDDARARQVQDVLDVVTVSTGVAVVARNTWAAMQGRQALEITWDEGRYAGNTSDSLRRMFTDLTATPGDEARAEGDALAAIASATDARRVEAIYDVPYLAHAPMEPLNCTADVRADRCEVWASTQGQSAAESAAMRVTSLPRERVTIHTLYMGGGFGRRAGSDYVGEAVEISKAIGAPVKLTWSREDDTQHDTYRPASVVRFSGAIDEDGWPAAVHARAACPSFRGPRPGVDRTAVEGLANMPYGLPHLRVEYHNPDAGVPVSYWRSVGYSQNVFFTESFLDELIAAGGRDPLEARRRLLAHEPRLLRALDVAARAAGWGTPLPDGHGRGLAVSDNIGSFTAQVAEVSVDRDRVVVHRVTCAVDCGQVVNPAIVAQQIRSGIVYGLSAALKGAITLTGGRVNETSFGNYDVIRMPEAPVVDVHVVPSRENPGGIGEASTPGIAPAVANALFAATGFRARRLPIRLPATS